MNQNVKLGAGFESYFHKCLLIKNWKVLRLPDGCRHVGQNKIIRLKSPFDYIATKAGGKSFYCDCKTTIGESFPFSAINQDQVRDLLGIQNNGHVAGFVIHFRQVDKYCFISAKELSEVVPGGSIKARAAIDLGKEIDIDKLFSSEKTNTAVN